MYRSAPGSPEPTDSDTSLRDVLVVLFVTGIVAAGLVDLFAPWPGLDRLMLLLCLVGGALCIAGIRYVPWHRLPRHLFQIIPLSALALAALAIAVSGGWLSPFGLNIALVVGFAAFIGPQRLALPIAVLGGLAAASPALYSHTGQPLAVLLNAVPSYIGLSFMIAINTQRMRAHEHRAAAAAAARERTEQRTAGLETLQRVSAIIARHLSVDNALRAIVEELGRAFGQRLVAVYLRDGEALVLKAQAGYPTPQPTIPLGAGICGRVATTGETIFLRDVRDDPAYIAALPGVISELCVPLKDGDTVAGVLNIETTDGPLTDLDRELLELFAVQVAVVLRNARAAGTLRLSAERDPLTDLCNHRVLMEAIDHTLSTEDAPCAVVLLDLDNFKLFNDVYGHLAGDAILRRIAATLRKIGRQGDLAGRLGGDEFLLLLPRTGRAAAEAVAARIVQAVAADPYRDADGTLIPLAVSAGIAVAPDDGQTRQEVLALADAAMYAHKRASRFPRLATLGQQAGDLLQTTPYGVLVGLVNAVGAKDQYTCEHSADVTQLALLLADRIGVSPAERHALAIAGPLHDVGKVGLPDTILRKPGRLADEEMQAVRQHVAIGLAIVRGVIADPAVLDAIAQHHERWDGQGYPNGLPGERTSLLGRIMQVADAASAMRLDRPYRAGLSADEVITRLRAGAGTQFDPDLVEAFIAAYLEREHARAA